MSNKQQTYDTIISLVEEELYQRLTSSGYKDSVYDGTKFSICGSSNIDFSTEELTGGSKSKSTKKIIPGKFDVIRYSHNLPLNVAIKGTMERQNLFHKELIP